MLQVGKQLEQLTHGAWVSLQVDPCFLEDVRNPVSMFKGNSRDLWPYAGVGRRPQEARDNTTAVAPVAVSY
jgi:hypothetical protein